MNLLFIIWIFSISVTGFRRTQFVKQGDPTYQAFSLVNVYNDTTACSDLYIRMQSAWYGSSSRGWAAFAFGTQMKGALMFVMYGNPNSSPPKLTLSLRTANGNHPPAQVILPEHGPSVEIIHAGFNKVNKASGTGMRPSHIGLADFVIRGYEKWHSAVIDPLSDKQSMIWANNPDQDFSGNLAEDVGLEPHQYRTRGFMWIDLKSALAPVSFIVAINDSMGNTGVADNHFPDAPSDVDLEDGAAMLTSLEGQHGTSTPKVTDHSQLTSMTQPHSQKSSNDSKYSQTAVQNKLIWRLNLWHFHGFLMALSYIILLPMGLLIRARSSPGHESLSALWKIHYSATLCAIVSAGIALGNSSSVGGSHSVVGLVTVSTQIVQNGLGNHINTLRNATPTITRLDRIHYSLDWVVILLALLDLVLCLDLRGYGSVLTRIFVLVIALEIVVLSMVSLVIKSRQKNEGHIAWVADMRQYFTVRSTEIEGQHSNDYLPIITEGSEDN